jgi:UDP-3-O-[3-hydroxymyristoyl] glucosamine N-acyltransferase
MPLLSELALHLNATFIGRDVSLARISSTSASDSESITFAVDTHAAQRASASAASAVIVREVDAPLVSPKSALIHKDPYFAYAKLAQLLAPRKIAKPGIHASAVVEASAQVHPTAEIGPLVYLAHNSKIGAHVRIHAGVRVGSGTIIGEGCELFPNAVLYHLCVVGARCIIHSGAVIGSDGFGFAPNAGAWEKIPQTGRVVIGDDVEVGANTTIDRGALDDTIIGNGVKLDNQIQIAHNCVIGDFTAVAGCVGMAGSSIIGKHCMIGGAAMISGHLTICDRVVVSAGTLISSDITEPGRYTGVMPTVTHAAWRKMAVRVRKFSQ